MERKLGREGGRERVRRERDRELGREGEGEGEGVGGRERTPRAVDSMSY
jgi:hypothetical protein